MQKNLEIINRQEVLGKDFKVYGDFDNPLFLAKDVAQWIDYNVSSVNKMLASVDDDEKTTRKIIPSGSNYQTEAWFLTEDGLYEVLMQSRKPIAKKFKKEVKQILKSIRKHGGYIKEDLIDELLKSRGAADDFMRQLKAEKKITRASDKLIKTQNQLITSLKSRLEEITPEAEYCENVLTCENAIPVSVIAKDYGVSAQRFNQILRELKIHYKVGGVWVLFAKYDGNGYTATRTYEKEGRAIVYTVWTQLGREFLYRKLRDYGIIPEYEAQEDEFVQLTIECDFYE